MSFSSAFLLSLKTVSQFISVAQSYPILCDPMGCSMPGFPVLQHPPRACSNSCPSSQWCHPTISSSVIPSSFCLQSFPASGSFPMSQFFTSDGQRIGASAPIYKIVSSLKTGCFPSQTVCIFKDWGLKHEWQGTLMFQTEMLSHLCAIAFKQQLMVDVVDNGRGFCVCVCVCEREMLAGLWAWISSLHVRWKGLQHSVNGVFKPQIQRKYIAFPIFLK